MNILVTGSGGFIGSKIVSRLIEKGMLVTKFSGDVTKPDSFDQGEFDVLIHLASLISHRDQYEEKEFKAVNIEGTRNICNFYKNSKIVYISTKDVEREKLDTYAESKLEAEKIVVANKKNLIVRLPSVFGPNQRQTDKLIPKLFRHFTENEEVNITSDDQREYVFVDEAVEQIINSINKTGLIGVDGAKIHNLRLKDLIESIFTNKTVANTNPDEQKMLIWLRATAEKL